MSKAITQCQVCDSKELELVFSLGWLPNVNVMQKIGEPLQEQKIYPAELYQCKQCSLVQLGYEVSSEEVFPIDYAYRSGSTRLLLDNFKDLAKEVLTLYPHTEEELVCDIGANDGSLLKQFKVLNYHPVGIEPTIASQDCKQICTCFSRYLDDTAVGAVIAAYGRAKVVTACNVFAHIPNPNQAVEHILNLMTDDGIFVSESHYLPSLLEGVQFDAIYHEHLRYYGLHSLKYLLEQHGMEVIHAKKIPTHGGSIRVYAARLWQHKVQESVKDLCGVGVEVLSDDFSWRRFRALVVNHKSHLLPYLLPVRHDACRIFGVGCPSRAVTLINYLGFDVDLLEKVVEIPGSPKIGHYVPGTMIPVVDEEALFREKPDYALLLSWHLADELIPKLRAKGFYGKFIIPLPEVKVIE